MERFRPRAAVRVACRTPIPSPLGIADRRSAAHTAGVLSQRLALGARWTRDGVGSPAWTSGRETLRHRDHDRKLPSVAAVLRSSRRDRDLSLFQSHQALFGRAQFGAQFGVVLLAVPLGARTQDAPAEMDRDLMDRQG